MTQTGSKWPKNDISEMSRFTRFAKHKFPAARQLKLFCTPADLLDCPTAAGNDQLNEFGDFSENVNH